MLTISPIKNPIKCYLTFKMTYKQKIEVLNGFLAPKNIRIEVLHKALVQIWAGIYHSILFMVAILDFCANRPLGDNLNLFVGVSENLVPIPITMQKSKTGHKVDNSA